MTSFLRTRKDRHPKPENKTRLHTTYGDVQPENIEQLTIEKSASVIEKKLIKPSQYGTEKCDDAPPKLNKQLHQASAKSSAAS